MLLPPTYLKFGRVILGTYLRGAQKRIGRANETRELTRSLEVIL